MAVDIDGGEDELRELLPLLVVVLESAVGGVGEEE